MVLPFRAAAVFIIIITVVAAASHPLRASDQTKTKLKLTGYLVDMTCATDPKKDLSALRTQHTRKCLFMPVCRDNGYALLTDDNRVLQFDAKGNELAQELIDHHPKTQSWKVMVYGANRGKSSQSRKNQDDLIGVTPRLRHV